MAAVNKVILIGNLGRDPEKRVTPQGNSVVTLSLATTEKYKDRNGALQESTEWHRVIFWNQQAETLERYCRKGSSLYIEGSIRTREYQDKDGARRWTTEIQGRSFQFLSPPPQGSGQPSGGGYQAPAASQPQQGSYQPQNTGGQPQGGFQNNPAQSYNAPPMGPGPDDFIEDDIPF